MKKIFAIFAVAIAAIMFNSCGSSKKTVETTQDYVEEIEVYGFGIGKDKDEAFAREQAKTMALAELCTKLQANVKTASSNYMRKYGDKSEVLFESLSEVVSENRLVDVKYKGAEKWASRAGGVYEYRIKAYAKATLKKEVDSILNIFDVAVEDREEFRREMFGE